MDRRAALGVVERGRLEKRSELAGFGRADEGKFSHTLPLAKAMDDVIVAHAQMASRSARAATQLHVGRVDEKGFSGGRSSM